MRRKNVTLFIGIGLVMLYCFFIHIDAKAGNESEKVLSIGRYEYDYDKSGIVGDNSEDVVFDAEDLYFLYKLCR